jgi:hypothetical protein
MAPAMEIFFFFAPTQTSVPTGSQFEVMHPDLLSHR